MGTHSLRMMLPNSTFCVADALGEASCPCASGVIAAIALRGSCNPAVAWAPGDIMDRLGSHSTRIAADHGSVAGATQRAG